MFRNCQRCENGRNFIVSFASASHRSASFTQSPADKFAAVIHNQPGQ